MNIKNEFHQDVETGIRVVSNKIVIWEIKCKLLDMTICMTPMVLEINAKMCVISSDAGDRVHSNLYLILFGNEMPSDCPLNIAVPLRILS